MRRLRPLSLAKAHTAKTKPKSVWCSSLFRTFSTILYVDDADARTHEPRLLFPRRNNNGTVLLLHALFPAENISGRRERMSVHTIYMCVYVCVCARERESFSAMRCMQDQAMANKTTYLYVTKKRRKKKKEMRKREMKRTKGKSNDGETNNSTYRDDTSRVRQPN